MCVGETEDGLSYSERQVKGARGKVPTLFFCHEWVRASRYVVPTLSADVGVRSSPDVSMTKGVT